MNKFLMKFYLLSKLVICSLFIPALMQQLSAEENFLLIDGVSNEKMIEMGSRIEERFTPGSTFKIALSLMGFDAGILKDEKTPVWTFQEGYDSFLPSWKNPQTPESWLKMSCVWYSKVLTTQLGFNSFQNYLKVLQYGNQDASGGLTKAWLNSSLKISLKEQVEFIKKMVKEELPISKHAIQTTRNLLWVEELIDGWHLYGKTGWVESVNHLENSHELGWFVGWIEKDNHFFPFAYTIHQDKIDLSQRIPRVKQLLVDSSIMTTYVNN